MAYSTLPMLTVLRSSVQDYWKRDEQRGGASLRPAVVGHLRYVTELITGARLGALSHDLQALAAELAHLAGWACFDAHQYSTARVYLRQALSCMSLQATYEGSATDAVALTCAAQDAARQGPGSSPVDAMLHMREAFAHAALHDAAARHQAIRPR